MILLFLPSFRRSVTQQGRFAHWPRDGPGDGQNVRAHTRTHAHTHTHTYMYHQAHTVYCTGWLYHNKPTHLNMLLLFVLISLSSSLFFICVLFHVFAFYFPLLSCFLFFFSHLFSCLVLSRIAQISVSPGSNSSGSAVGGLKEVQRKASPRRNIHHRRKMEVESDGSTEETDSSENWPLTFHHSVTRHLPSLVQNTL